MEIRLNDITNPQRLLVFDAVPNILTAEESYTTTKSRVSISINGTPSVTADSQYYISLASDSITNVMAPSSASSTRFYIAPDNASTAASIARALRNCGNVITNWTVKNNGSSVTLEARTGGAQTLDITTNWSNITTGYTGGTSTSTMANGKVLVDVTVDNNYITTLEKNFYGSGTAFDMSTVLASYTDYGKITEFSGGVSTIDSNGIYTSQGIVNAAATKGYGTSGSSPYLILTEAYQLTPNYLCSTYSNNIIFSVYLTSMSNVQITGKLYDSIGNQIYTSAVTITPASRLVETGFTFPQDIFQSAHKAVITIGDRNVEYDIIKPIKMAEGNTRINWYNEYGGISYFDFTGAKTTQNNLSTATYNKSNFDYYTAGRYEDEKVYRNDSTHEITVTSHLLSEQQAKIFDSLLHSRKMWETKNGNRYIIPISLDVEEIDEQNGIYTATFTYKYSNAI